MNDTVVVFSFGLVSLILLIVFACTRVRFIDDPDEVPPVTMAEIGRPVDARTRRGLDEVTLRSYPKLLYSEAKFHQGYQTTACCSICLLDYKETDTLRVLPYCGHLFHLKCVDPWLKLSGTCPICRKSPIPAPEVAVQADPDAV